MKLKPVAIVCLLLFSYFAFSQNAEKCGTDKLLHDFFANDPDATQKFELNRSLIGNYLSNNASRDSRNIIITIPVVFHVIYNGQPIGTGLNISAAQIQSQIAVLNECYRLRNSDTSAIPPWFQGRQADIEIEFCLATFDTAGSPTSGITRHSIANTNNFDTDIKPITQWAPSKYLNIWTTNLGNTLLGYATPPGLFPWNQDGVVLDFRHVGKAPDNPYSSTHDQGRTCVHEVGHWLNLFHTFQDSCVGMTPQTCNLQGDFICDTPPEKEATFGQPNLLQNTCHETPVDENDMWMNYMDYADDDQMHLFTHDQRDVIRATLSTSRLSLQSSLGCTNAFNSFSFSGTVVDATTNTPVANARVLFDGQEDFEALADGNGNFTIPALIDDYYDIYAGKWGYNTSLFATHTALNSGSGGITIAIENHHYYDDFTFDYNWTKTATASSGFWTRSIPVGTFYQSEPAAPSLDAQDDFTLKCFVTGNIGGNAATDDVDNGTATLISPVFDLTGFNDPYLRYERWFYDGSQSSNTPDDNMVFKINNGQGTSTIESVDASIAPTNKWIQKTFRLNDYTTLTNNMRLIIDVNDANNGNPNIVEGGLDKFEIKEGVFSSITNLENEFVQATIYPNPSTGLALLQFTLSEPGSTILKVNNTMGEQVVLKQLESTRGSNTVSLDFSIQPAGIYFVSLQGQHSEKTLKFSLLR
jgi:hypothetical protein